MASQAKEIVTVVSASGLFKSFISPCEGILHCNVVLLVVFIRELVFYSDWPSGRVTLLYPLVKPLASPTGPLWVRTEDRRNS